MGSDNRHVEVKLVGDQTADSVDAFVDESLKFNSQLRAKNRPVLSLIDISRLGRSDYIARRAGVRRLRNVRYDRLAMYGANPFWKQLIRFMVHVSGRGRKVGYFDTRIAALRWLNRGDRNG